MGVFIESVIAAAARTQALAGKLTADIPANIAARKPRVLRDGKETLAECNHAAWLIGHLSLYPARLLGLLGQDASAVKPPETFEPLFKAGSPCQDDPEGKIFPKFGEIVGVYTKNYEKLLPQIAALDESILAKPTPDERYQKAFPTLGAATVFMLNNHPMMHLGQLSTWRRCFGLPSVM